MRRLTRDQETMVCNGFDALAVLDGTQTIFCSEAAREMARISEAAGPGDIAARYPLKRRSRSILEARSRRISISSAPKVRPACANSAVQVTLRDANSIRDSGWIQIGIVEPFLHTTLQTHEH